MIDLSNYTDSLILNDDGIYISDRRSIISFPDNVHSWLREVEQNSFWFDQRNNYILQILSLFPPNGILFDIGGGNGYVSSFLNESGYNTVLVEPDMEGCINAIDRGLDTIICSSFESAGFLKHSLPSVGLFDVLEHIDDVIETLQHLYSLITPGGRLYLTVPAYQRLWSKDDEYAGHFRRYTCSSLLSSLKAAGFEIEMINYFFMAMTLPVWLFRSLPDKLGLNRQVNQSSILKSHRVSSSVLSGFLRLIHFLELAMLKHNYAFPFGSSIAAVARVPRTRRC